MLDLMRIFIQVVEEESYTLVARHLGVSQPAISNQMRALEEKLGVKLFQRQGKSFVLTPEGEVFYRYAQRILDDWNRLQEEIRLNPEEASGKVHLGASHIPGEYLLPYFLSRFQQEYPKISFKLSIGDSLEIADKVLTQDVDFAVVGSSFNTEKLDSQYWRPDRIKLVLGTDHPLQQQAVIRAEDLKEFPMVIRESGSGHRRAVEDALRKVNLHLEDFKISMEVGSTEAVKSAIRAGLGFSFLSLSAVQPYEKEFIVREVEGLTIERDFFLLTRRNKPLTKIAQLCYDFLVRSTE